MRYEESLALFRALEDKQRIARLVMNMAKLDETPRALTMLRESLCLCQDLGDKWTSAYCEEEVACRLQDEGDIRSAILLWGAADALRPSETLTPTEKAVLDERQARARSEIGAGLFEDIHRLRLCLSFSDSIDLTLALIESS